MAREHGRRGRLYVGLATSSAVAEPVTFLNKWDINFTVATVDVTAFGDANITYVSGLPDAKGTFAGFFDNASAQLFTAAQDGLARNFYLYPDATVGSTGPYWFGTALFDFQVQGGVAEAVSIQGNWSAASAITKIG